MIYVSIQLAGYRSFVGGVFQKWGHVLFSLSLAFSPPRFHGLDLSDAFDEKALFMSCFLHLFFILYIYTQILKQEKKTECFIGRVSYFQVSAHSVIGVILSAEARKSARFLAEGDNGRFLNDFFSWVSLEGLLVFKFSITMLTRERST